MIKKIDMENIFSNPSLEELKYAIVDAGPRKPSYGRVDNLEDHLLMLLREFSGHSFLKFYHAALITKIRRKVDLADSAQKFTSLWMHEADFLLVNLDSRWLVSACDTIVDVFIDPTERAAAIACILFTNTIKLYETERRTHPPQAPQTPIEGYHPLFDGMTAFQVTDGDMVKNMLDRTSSPFDAHFIAPRILAELLKRARTNDTVYKRFAALHKHKATQW